MEGIPSKQSVVDLFTLDGNERTGQWILYKARHNNIPAQIPRLSGVVGGSDEEALKAVETWTSMKRIPSHGLIVNDQGLRVFRASHEEAYGQHALYISFGFSRPTLGVYDMHLNTAERRLLTPSQPKRHALMPSTRT
jgi:hypothetical protein